MRQCMTCPNIRRGRRWDRHPGRGMNGLLTATAAPEWSLTTSRPRKLLRLLPPTICQFRDRGLSTDLRILPRIQRQVYRQEHKKIGRRHRPLHGIEMKAIILRRSNVEVSRRAHLLPQSRTKSDATVRKMLTR